MVSQISFLREIPYQNNITIGQCDALNGIAMLGDGQGGYKIVDEGQSGFDVQGEGRSLAVLRSKSGEKYILAATNNNLLKVFALDTKKRNGTIQKNRKNNTIKIKSFFHN